MMEETRDGREVERCGPDEVFGGRRAKAVSPVVSPPRLLLNYSVHILSTLYLLQVKCIVNLLKE